MTEREIDIHGMECAGAKKCLDSYINGLPTGEYEITVIHGYNRGSSLKKMLSGYTHKRLKGKYLSINQGVTILRIN